MSFGTVLITKDRNWCLERTVNALIGSELAEHPIVVVSNGSTREDPRQVLGNLRCQYLQLPNNLGIVGARFLAHEIAETLQWGHYCFLQDDFELKLARRGWLADTLRFVEKYAIDYCRLTVRECALGENEHWVKGQLRVKTANKRWNCSHVQIPKMEKVGETNFLLSDKHYSDWAHIMSMNASALLFKAEKTAFSGPSVTDRLLSGDYFDAFNGSVKTEFDTAVRHWIAYSLGLVSCTGIVSERPCWSGVFEHQTRISTCDYRDLPQGGDAAARFAAASAAVRGLRR